LHIGTPEIKKFNFNNCNKWLDLGAEGYSTEGFVGQFTCPGCRNKISAYREVVQTNGKPLKDALRFEQTIEGGSGRCVTQVQITFESEFTEMESRLLPANVLGTPCACDVVKEKFFATVKCMGCQDTLHFYNQVKRCKDVGRLRWFLTRKETKSIEEKLGLE